MDSLCRELMSEVEQLGMAARVVSIERLAELERDISEPRDGGMLDGRLVEAFLSGFEFTAPSSLPGASHIVILAHPEPVTVAEFRLAGRACQVAIPPIYLPEKSRADLRALRTVLEGHGYQTAGTRLPLKALAVRSGLGRYGRNNICYVPGMGSYLRLEAFFTNAPLIEDGWGAKDLMEACQNCSACEVACPTASIAPDRFIIRAERCLTFLNELEGEFPDWVQPHWHNALIGCMRCQHVCPQNAQLIANPVIGERFTEGETVTVLTATALDQLTPELRTKLARLEWGASNHLLMQRNLRALLRVASVAAGD